MNVTHPVTQLDEIDSYEILLSIIIPVFNCEEFIIDALHSLSPIKSRKDIQIIIVNDGSTDNSFKKINDFISNHQNKKLFKVINQENQGVSYSRNIGLSYAKGKYIGFLDGDDIFLNKFFETVIPIIKENQEEIIEFGFVRFNCSESVSSKSFKHFYSFNGKYLMQNVIDHIFAKTAWYPPIRIYRRDLWKNIYFPKNVAFAEDTMTITHIFKKAKSIYFIQEALYGYRYNSHSASSNHTIKQLKDLKNFYWEISNQLTFNKILKVRLARTISFFCHELNQFDNQYIEIREDAVSQRLSFKILQKMLFSDLFFFFFPGVYDFFNKKRF